MALESLFDASACTASVTNNGTSLWTGVLAKGQASPVFDGLGGGAEPMQLAADSSGVVTLAWQDGGSIKSDGYVVSIHPNNPLVLSPGCQASNISCYVADIATIGMAADVVSPPVAVPLSYSGTPPNTFTMSPNPANLTGLPGAVSITAGMGQTPVWPLVKWIDGVTQNSDTHTFGVTITKPVVAGDVIFMVCTETKPFNITGITPPAGWNVLTSQPNGGNTGGLCVIYRICDGSEGGATYTFTAGGSETGHWTAQMVSIEAGTYSFDPTKYSFNLIGSISPPTLTGHGGACFVAFLIDATLPGPVTQWPAADNRTSIANDQNGSHVCTQYSSTQASSLLPWVNTNVSGWHWVAVLGLSRSA